MKLSLGILAKLFDLTPTSGSTKGVTSGGIKTALDAKANLSGGNTFSGSQILNDLSGSTILGVNGSKTIVNLSTTTYPSFAELAYLKGTTSSVQTQIDAKAPSASPTFIGDPKAPTAALGDNDTSIATTAFVQQEINSKILSGSATLDFPSTDPGNTQSLTVTVTGAAVGDVVSLGTPAPANGCNYYGYVSATNTVTVNHINASSIAVNPASATFKVKVFK